MARPRRNAALPLEQEIQRQGYISLLKTDGPASTQLKDDFYRWLRKHNEVIFDQLANDFALASIKGQGS